MTAFLERQYSGRAGSELLRGYTYELVRCAQCDLAYQKAVPASQLLDEIYNVWIPATERQRLAEARTVDEPSYWANEVHFIIEHLRRRPMDVRVLDFGMGWAEWAGMARAYGCEVYGTELSSERRNYARSIGIQTLDLEEIGKQRFHFINTEQVFEHLIDPLDILKRLSASLTDDGVLKISVPNSRAALRRVSRQRAFAPLSSETIMPISPLEHVNCFEYKTLVSFAAAAGLAPIRPSIRLLYNASSGWLHPARGARLLLRPIYRHIYPKSTFAYFVRTPGAC
ncbi:MAG TPA: methyltransferase domain-containing protein [Steroidobacteraceae bacterium]|nr:methyltransferase domain-containing protein [Steroidobacteraceae bacterium]